MGRFRFLGGAEEIGSLGLVVESEGTRLLIDYGLSPDKPPTFPDQAPHVDGVLLTHAHLDHSGCLPEVATRQDVDVHLTPPTRRIARILHHDTLKIATIEGHRLPFAEPAVERLAGLTRDLTIGEPFRVGALTVTARGAGHIPGAVQFAIDDGQRRTVFTGDLFTRPTRLVPPAEVVPCETLFIESTYAGRAHADREAEERRFAAKVDETVERGGVALVAAFATGRTQEVLLTLVHHTDHEIWVDGMGARVLDILLDEPAYVRDIAALRHVRERVRVVRDHRQRRHALNTGAVVVATSGMLEGGPILHYLGLRRKQTRDSLLLTGYQVEGTNGRRLLDEGVYEDRGVRLPVELEIDRFDLSTHIGHDDIVEHVRRTKAEHVVLYHGYRREQLVDDLSDHAEVHLPMRGETFGLDGTRP